MSLLTALASRRRPATPTQPETPGTPPAEPWADPEEGSQFLTTPRVWNYSNPPDGAALPVHDRALGWYFEGEDVVITFNGASDIAAWELRDYEGEVVASGSTPVSPLNLGQPGIGWYKLYFIRASDSDQRYGLSGGETTFVVSRTGVGLRDTPIPVADEGSGWVSSANRSYIGTGLVRLDVYINTADPAAWRKSLDHAKTLAIAALPNVAMTETSFGSKRHVFAQFPAREATGGADPSPEQVAQVTTSIQELCELGVTHFEGRNEPVTSGISGAETAAAYAAFAPVAHAAHPDARVCGPCPVNINPKSDGIGWFRDFLAAGGGDHVDVITFHPYNATNNDANMGRETYQRFVDLLAEYGADDKPRWMTEYGHYSHVYGSFEPRWHAQTMMTEGHLLWQVAGVHRNHIMHYYDFNVGYWAQPMFMWTSQRGRKCPTPLPLMWRTWVEETWDMDLVEKLDFGPFENRHYIGSRFRRANGIGCLTIQATGRFGDVTLSVSGATSLVVADYFGRTTTVPVTAGRATVAVGPEPCHVRLPVGVTATVVPINYGADVTPRESSTVSATSGGNGAHRVIDGILNNQYATGRSEDGEWRAMPGDSGPSWWKAEFAPTTFDRVEVICPPPWQHSGSLLDFDIQVRTAGQWQTIDTRIIPTPEILWTSDKAVGACLVDSFWSRERIFVTKLPLAVTATGVRIYARDMSFGGGATINNVRTLRITEDGQPCRLGQPGRKRMTIQEVALYKS